MSIALWPVFADGEPHGLVLQAAADRGTRFHLTTA
jgi:hypothetical protein